jgi:hypothetical protein
MGTRAHGLEKQVVSFLEIAARYAEFVDHPRLVVGKDITAHCIGVVSLIDGLGKISIKIRPLSSNVKSSNIQ